MISLKLFILLTLLFATIMIVFSKQAEHFKKLINDHIKLKGWGDADVAKDNKLNDYIHFGEKRWSRSDWGLTEAVISAVVACAMLLSGRKLTRYLRMYEGHIEQIVEERIEKLAVELKNKLIITLYSELEGVEATMKEELSHYSRNQDTEMENKGTKDDLSILKTSQINYFPPEENHINEWLENMHPYELCQTSDNDTPCTTNSETKIKSSVKTDSIINTVSNRYNCDNVPLICSANRSEGTNSVICISECKDMLLEPKEVTVTTAIKSCSVNRRIPQYQGLTRVSRKQDIERVGSLTILSHVKNDSTNSRSGTHRHQYSSGPRPESADTQSLSADNRRKKQRNTSANY